MIKNLQYYNQRPNIEAGVGKVVCADTWPRKRNWATKIKLDR
jgi:hypothetical protein